MQTETVLGVLDAGEGYLRERGVAAPRLSIEWMLARVLGITRLQVYMAHDRPVSETEKQSLREMVARRGTGEPLAYVLGDQEFCGLQLRVTNAVLIPRPETEGLVELVRAAVAENALGVDIGTGSGAIAIALCSLRPDLRMIATDVSQDALAVARQNAEKIGVADRIDFALGDYWQALDGRGPVDFVVSNPPYVDPGRPDLLGEGVAEFEPALALFTPPDDPAASYRALVRDLEGRLRPGGQVFFETGVAVDQVALETMRAVPDLVDVELQFDDAKLPRYLLARYAGSQTDS
ncbi:MAG: peptide chain release factor N(5)-glutamine methyltransferase [Planctomycetota bacterium]|nr:peptide chain release factor N(5)-glutamine methyltransferase [Planctomycetota bacterium]